MIFKPYTYQWYAGQFLMARPFTGLFADPGLGKTVITLAHLNALKMAGMLRGALIIAPRRPLRITWPDEIKHWQNKSNLTYAFLHGTKKDKAINTRTDIYLTTPDTLPWLYQKLREGTPAPFNVLVVDESSFFQGHASRRFAILSRMLDLFDRRIILNGTPASESLHALWAQIYLLDKGHLLGHNITTFRQRYFHQVGERRFNTWKINPGAEEQIYQAIAHLVLRIDSSDWLSIPPRLYNKIPVRLDAKTLKVYRKVERDLFAVLDPDIIFAPTKGAAYGLCRQLAGGQYYEYMTPMEREQGKERVTKTLHKAKLDALQNLTLELQGKPVLVLYQFQHELERLRKAFNNPPFIGRGTTDRQAETHVTNWNAGRYPILLGHPGSMGHGLNMQHGPGRDICFYGIPNRLEHYEQTIKRVHRNGVSGPTRVHLLITENTIDEAILKALEQKDTTQQGMFKALKQYAQERGLI